MPCVCVDIQRLALPPGTFVPFLVGHRACTMEGHAELAASSVATSCGIWFSFFFFFLQPTDQSKLGWLRLFPLTKAWSTLFITTAQSICKQRWNNPSACKRASPAHPCLPLSCYCILGVNKNQNCQRPDRTFTNNLTVHSAVLKHDWLSHAEYQLRWHLMCIIIIVRLHVYFRFSRFKCEVCASVWHH